MSFAIQLLTASKAATKDAVEAALESTVAEHPELNVCRVAAQAVAEEHIDLLADDESKDVAISISGSVLAPDGNVHLVSIGLTVQLVDRVAA